MSDFTSCYLWHSCFRESFGGRGWNTRAFGLANFVCSTRTVSLDFHEYTCPFVLLLISAASSLPRTSQQSPWCGHCCSGPQFPLLTLVLEMRPEYPINSIRTNEHKMRRYHSICRCGRKAQFPTFFFWLARLNKIPEGSTIHKRERS